MASPPSDPPPVPDEPAPASDHAPTLHHDATPGSVPANGADDSFDMVTRAFAAPGTASHLEEDVALATEVIRSGLLNDRQLATLFSEWSLHGSVRLADHLREQELLPKSRLVYFEQQAVNKAAANTTPVAGGDTPVDVDQSLAAVLSRYDETGRVARLFGVSGSSGVVEEASSRRSPVRYELLRKLGQGGLGRVWLARDQVMQRLVALKEVTNAGDASEITLARFRNEAEITGRLEHPGIVPIYQLGIDADTGNSFYTMRFLGKSTLQDAIAEYHERREAGDHDAMRLRELLTAFVNICHAIGHAHSRNVIHRDLKPENVVIDNFGQVIVIDWGLAKLIDDAALEQLGGGAVFGENNSTVEGQVLGTPLYMAPEQAAGRLDEIDTRTDIYGLGGILFAIVTGQAPHEQVQTGAAQTGGGGRAMISSIVSGPTPDATTIHSQVPAPLAAVCAKAMARRRYARYQSASELADDVQRWMADEPVTAYKEPPVQQAKRWVGRHQRLSQVLASLAAILIAAAVTLGVSARQAAVAAQQSRFEQMRGDAREVELQLRSSSRALAGDARFMAGLPPIQGIIRYRANVKDEDSETVWRQRLENIFSGLLRSESEYLAVAYVAAKDGGAEEVVRVERNTADRTLLRALPVSRLRFFESDTFLNAVLELEPGDTRLSFDPRPWQSETAARTKRLSIAVPIYSDIDGEPFGMVVIETDVERQLERILDGLGQPAGDIFITNKRGMIESALTSRDGVTTKHNKRSVTRFAPSVARLYELPFEQRDLDDGATFVAKLRRVHPTDPGCGIVVTLPRE